MEQLTRERIEELIDEQGDGCVSLYLPTHRSLPEARQDPIRFKNLLRAAEAELEAKGLQGPEIKEQLKQARALLDDADFWRHQSDGLAVFLSANKVREYRLPVSFKELSVVSDRFHTKPLLPLLSSDNRFFILALSQNDVRLIEATLYGASEVKVENVPGSLADILGKYDSEGQLQFHTGAAQSGGGRAAVFHGQGAATEDIKPRISEYFRQIDAGLREHFKDESAPLVLSGVESLFPLYREVNTYPHLVTEGIAGNPEQQSAEELRLRAWSIVEPQFIKSHQDAANKYQALAGTGRTSNDLKEVVTAAHEGRIEVLFVALGVQVWGSFDKQGRTIAVHQETQAGDRDLLDLCAVQALSNRGSVHVVEPEAVPGEGLLAAVFRF